MTITFHFDNEVLRVDHRVYWCSAGSPTSIVGRSLFIPRGWYPTYYHLFEQCHQAIERSVLK